MATNTPTELAETGAVDTPAEPPKRRRKTDENAHKTVTFGDGSAITGSTLWSIISVISLMVVWWFLKAQNLPFVSAENLPLLNDRTLPSQGQVWEAFVLLVTEGYRNVSLWENIWASFQRVLLGLGFGVLIGVPIGLSMGLSNVARGVWDPVVEGFRPIPPLAFIALVILWFGLGETGKVVILFFAAVWIMIISARSGVLNVQVSKVHAAYSLGASKAQIARHVIIPNALPEILTGMRVALGVCWGTLVAAEILGAQEGLGAMIWAAQKFIRIDVVVVGIIIISVIGVALDLGMRWLERTLIPWRGKG